MVNQPTSQPTNQPTNKPINQSTNELPNDIQPPILEGLEHNFPVETVMLLFSCFQKPSGLGVNWKADENEQRCLAFQGSGIFCLILEAIHPNATTRNAWIPGKPNGLGDDFLAAPQIGNWFCIVGRTLFCCMSFFMHRKKVTNLRSILL